MISSQKDGKDRISHTKCNLAHVRNILTMQQTQKWDIFYCYMWKWVRKEKHESLFKIFSLITSFWFHSEQFYSKRYTCNPNPDHQGHINKLLARLQRRIWRSRNDKCFKCFMSEFIINRQLFLLSYIVNDQLFVLMQNLFIHIGNFIPSEDPKGGVWCSKQALHLSHVTSRPRASWLSVGICQMLVNGWMWWLKCTGMNPWGSVCWQYSRGGEIVNTHSELDFLVCSDQISSC